jgi:hypothetical protein
LIEEYGRAFPGDGPGDAAPKGGANGSVKFPDKPPEHWKNRAWDIALEWMLDQEKQTGTRPGGIAIAKHVEGELSRLDIRGARGKWLDRETIRREVLTGITERPRAGKKSR